MQQIKIKISQTATAEEVSNNLSKMSAENILGVLDKIFAKKTNFIEQNHEIATYAKKIKKNEAKINWSMSVKKILAKINGLNPDPGAWFIYKKKRYKIWSAKICEKKGPSGTIIDSNFIIGCGDKSLEIIEIQKEGKKKLYLKDFLMGMNFKFGDELK